MVIFPMGDANVVTSTPGLRDTPDLANYYRPLDRQLPFVPNRAQRGSADEVRFVCGYFGCDARPFNPLLDALPRLLHCPGGPPGGWLAQVIRLAVEESDGHRTGGETVLAKASELLFVEVVRSYINSLPEGTPAAGSPACATRTSARRSASSTAAPPRTGPSTGSPARPASSRSVFADRFSAIVGTSPMNYLGRWRMQLAAGRLELPGISIAQAGAEVGYESEAAFNRAFKKYVGMPPGSWRRRHRISPNPLGAARARARAGRNRNDPAAAMAVPESSKHRRCGAWSRSRSAVATTFG